MFPACSAAADQILPAEFLKFKEGRNFPLKKNTSKGIQHLSGIWDVFVQHLQDCEVQGANGEDKDVGLFSCFPLKFTRGNNFGAASSGWNS